jgi:hypothetical protein
MSELKQALMTSQDITEDQAETIIQEMVERVLDGENPEEILYEEGLEPDYVFDIINRI